MTQPTDIDAMMIQVPVEDVLDLLDDGANWVKGVWSDVDDNMCLHGGIRACQVIPGDAALIERVAAVQGWGTGFNDADDTTWPMVRAALTAHREVTPPELETVFGPQWKIIVRVVRQAATLTPDQTAAIYAAYAASSASAAAAAYAASAASHAAAAAAAAAYAASAAAYAASAASASAAYAASAASYASAVYADAAARAMAMRHLISVDGFTQTQYDLLTAPWRTLFPGFDEVAA